MEPLSFFIKCIQMQVDMPVFFYIDPEYATDPRLENIDDIVLSYVFFEAKEGAKLPFINHAKASK